MKMLQEHTEDLNAAIEFHLDGKNQQIEEITTNFRAKAKVFRAKEQVIKVRHNPLFK